MKPEINTVPWLISKSCHGTVQGQIPFLHFLLKVYFHPFALFLSIKWRLHLLQSVCSLNLWNKFCDILTQISEHSLVLHLMSNNKHPKWSYWFTVPVNLKIRCNCLYVTSQTSVKFHWKHRAFVRFSWFW